jgi:hypothetical protein
LTDELASIRLALDQRSTEDLVLILRKHDEEEWHPEVFDIVRSIRVRRGVFLTDVARLPEEMAESAAQEGLPEGFLGTPPQGWPNVAQVLGMQDAERAGELLGHEGMPFFLDARHGRHSEINLYVPPEHAWIAGVIPEKEGLIPPQLRKMEQPLGPRGGRCPACGSTVPPGRIECPECGLVLGEDPSS